MNIFVVIVHWGHKNDAYFEQVKNVWEAMGAHVEVLHTVPTGQDPCSLPFQARPILAKALHESDATLYCMTEDDMLITQRNIMALVEVTRSCLHENEVAGFMRYEVDTDGKRVFPDMHAGFHWCGDFGVEDRHGLKFARFTNEHQGCYVLTPEQLRRLISSGNFLVPMHSCYPPYGPLECAATDPFICPGGLRRVICLSRFDDFLIRHLPGNYIYLGRKEAAVREDLRGMGVEWAKP